MFGLKVNKPLILDTNLLILVLVGLFDINSIGTFKRTNKYSERDYNNLIDIVKQFPKLVITPHIFAEISNLCFSNRDKNKDNQLYKFINHIVKVLFEFKELTVHKNQLMILAYFPRIGVTDSGIIEIAKRNKYNVITEDASIYLILNTLGVPVLNINHIRAF